MLYFEERLRSGKVVGGCVADWARDQALKHLRAEGYYIVYCLPTDLDFGHYRAYPPVEVA